MGKLIATTQATIDGVVDPVGEWVDAPGAVALAALRSNTRARVLRRAPSGGSAGSPRERAARSVAAS